MINKPGTSVVDPTNPMRDIEVLGLPGDSISALKFSPGSKQNFLAAGSWDQTVRYWEIAMNGTSTSKALQDNGASVLDIAWSHDCSKIYIAGTDNCAKMWDLQANLLINIANHSAPVKTCTWINTSNFCCLMTASWDKTLKFWDIRSPLPVLSFDLPERCYCSDVDYPMVVVGMAGKLVGLYNLERKPQKQEMNIPLFNSRSVAIFKNKERHPDGFALGCTDGRVAIHYLSSKSSEINFSFKCHRIINSNDNFEYIYAVNDLAFHPVHGTLATVGSDGTYAFWNKDTRSMLKSSEVMEQSIVKCDFNCDGRIFAYAVSYDWGKGHHYYDKRIKDRIFLRDCFNEMRCEN